jgi:hypothetical protein
MVPFGHLEGAGERARRALAAQADEVVEHGELRRRQPVRQHPFQSVARKLLDDADLVQHAESDRIVLHARISLVSNCQRGAGGTAGP